MEKVKYLITLWKEMYDYDGLTDEFRVDFETVSLDDADKKIVQLADTAVEEGLKNNAGFFSMEVDSFKKSPRWTKVNKNNKVIKSEVRKIGDGSGYYSIYYYFELLEIPKDKKVDENLFNSDGSFVDGNQEVRNFFKDRS